MNKLHALPVYLCIVLLVILLVSDSIDDVPRPPVRVSIRDDSTTSRGASVWEGCVREQASAVVCHLAIAKWSQQHGALTSADSAYLRKVRKERVPLGELTL